MRIFNPNDIIIDVRAWYQAATERRELLAMDDRMLRDIGITRIDAVRAAREPMGRVVSLRWAMRPRKQAIPRTLIDAHIARAHRLHDETIRNTILGVGRWLRDAFRGLRRPQPIVRARKLAPIAR
jgi:uncharacterized protein YjiS (DUF1127 family)